MTPHVTYTLDRNFTVPTLVSAWSLLSHRPRDIEVLLLYTEDPGPDLAKVEGLARAYPEATVTARHAPEITHAHGGRSHVSAAGLSRLLLPRALDRPTLYLDGDTLVRRDIGEVFALHLTGNPVAAVRDVGIQKILHGRSGHPTSRKERSNRDYLDRIADLVDAADYFNSGVMLFDLPAIRAAGLAERMQDTAAAIALRTGRDLKFDDQTWLNVVFRGHTHFLPPEWNTFWGNRVTGDEPFPQTARDAYAASRANPAIVHFVGKTRPWTIRHPAFHPKRKPWIGIYHDIMARAMSAIGAPA